MTFTVTYREKSGAKAEMEIEASGRAECVSACKARGIAPLSVKEGRSQGARRHSPQDRHDAQDRRRAPFLRVLCVLGVLGVLVLGAWLWFSREAPRPAPAEKPARPKAAKPQPAPRSAPKPAAKPAATNAPAVVEVARKRESPVAATNGPVVPKGPVYTNQVKAMGHIEAIGIDGQPIPRHKPIFRKPLERALATGLMPMRSAGVSVAANMRRYTDEQIIAMLKEPVTISKDDTESAIEAKLNVQELKERVLRHVEEGGSVRDVFEEIDAAACGTAHERHLTRIGLEEAKRLGDPEVVRAWVEARNKRLRELGMQEIRVPAKFREPAAEGDQGNVEASIKGAKKQ